MTNGSILNWMKARVRGSNEFRSERRRHCKRPQPPIPALAQDDAILYRARRRDIQRETASPLFPSSPRGGRTTSPTHIYEEISYRRDYSAPSDSGFRASVNIDNLMFDEAKTFGRFLIVPMKPDSDRGVQQPAVNRKLGYRDVTSAATGSSDDYEGESSCGSSGCGETPRCRQRLRNGAVYNCSRTFPSPPTTTSATTTTADDSGFYSPPETRRYSMHESAPSRSYLRMLERNEAITTPTSPPRRPAHRHHQVSLDHEPLRATTSNGYRLPSLNETTLPFGENGSYYRTSSTARPNRKTSGDTPTIHASGLPKAPPPLTSNRSLESPVYPTTPSTGCSSSQASSPNYDLLNRCSPVSGNHNNNNNDNNNNNNNNNNENNNYSNSNFIYLHLILLM